MMEEGKGKETATVNDDERVLPFFQNNWASLREYLSDFFKTETPRNGTARKPFVHSPEIIDNIFVVLDLISKCETVDEDVISLHANTLRVLRNCLTNPDTQNYISDNYLPNLKRLYQVIHIRKAEVVCKVFLMVLINITVDNENAVKKVYDVFKAEIIDNLYCDYTEYEASALLNNILIFINIDFDDKVTQKLFQLFKQEDDNEYSVFIVEKLLQTENFWSKNFVSLKLDDRLVCLEFLHSNLIRGKLKVPEKALEILVEHFINSNEVIFQTVQNNGDDKPYEVSKLLSVICSLSGKGKKYLKLLQKNKDLIINCGVLLINIHRLGKLSDNCFSTLQKLSEIREPNENITQHAAFGFKADLVRLIGNLCWKCKQMQDLARQAEIIPVLLDCCNMDARNPLIMQWVILAIRNLCKNNLENQKIIAGLKQEGAVSSATLEEMGLTLHCDGDSKLNIVPLDSLKK